jgi:hypothetical protein
VYAVLFATLLGAQVDQPVTQPNRVPLTWTGLREVVGSSLVRPGMTSESVEWLMGLPFGVDSHGPPGRANKVYTYFWSGISVTFGPDGKVRGTSGGYWKK